MTPVRHWTESETSPPKTDAPRSANVYTPPLDIHETPEGLVLEADLPGVPPDQLEVRVEQNVLTIYGKVDWSHLPADAQFIYEEVLPGDYFRSFILGDEVDTERISAEFNNGVLRLMLPKAAKARPRKIEIRTSSSSQTG